MIKRITFLFSILLSNTFFAQRTVSVIESFCNTGDLNAQSSIPALHDQAAIADTNDENHVYIQHHVNQTYSDWTDQYATQASTDRYHDYIGLGIINGTAKLAVNGEASTATPWYNCAPVERDVYSTGSKKMTVLFNSYDPLTSKVKVKFVLALKYQTTDTKSVYVYMS